MTYLPRSVLLALLALTLGCDREPAPPASALPTIKMTIGSREFTIEVADTDRDRKYGLMKRDSMPADHGMLFVFSDEDERSFYMRNTRIPLDILYLDAAGRVVSIKQMTPLVETSVPSDFPAKYAVELNKDTATAIGAKVGTQLKIPENIKAKD